MSAYERVMDALEAHGSARQGRNWQCPAHPDRKASLTVTARPDKVLLHCQASCPPEEVVRALGLEMKDLYDESGPPRMVARYPYTDADGTLLFEKRRYEPKDFLVFHPEERGWEPKIGDAKPVLYRLPELKEAIAKGKTVYIVEGEKDVDRMAEFSHVATCNYEGACKWRDGYSSHFTGATVIIVADRDEPGYQHAKMVKASLLKAGVRSVQVMQPAVERAKADISDHFAAGYGIDDLVPLGGAFIPVKLGSLVANGVDAPERLADGMLYAGGLHCIAGAPDSGKTTIALYWAVKLLSEGRTVAFFDEEGGQEIIAEKLRSLGGKVSEVENLVYVPFPGKMWDDSDVAELMEFLGGVRPAMVLWDSSAAFLARAGLDENSAPAVTNWWARVLIPLARELRAAVVVIDHDTKASEQSRYARGSGAKLATLDVQYKVEIKQAFSRDRDGLLRVTVTKDRRGYLHRAWLVQMLTQHGIIKPDFVHDSEEAYYDSFPQNKRKVFGALADMQSRSNEEIQEVLRELFPDDKALDRSEVSKQCNELMRDGLVARSGNETRGVTWRRLR